MLSRRRRTILLLVALALLVPVGFLQNSVDRDRFLYGLGEPLPYWQISRLGVEGVTGAIIGAVMGGFRGVAADMLWVKCDELFHTGQMHLFLPVAHTIVMLDPHFIEVWTVTGWHMAYNMFYAAQEEGDWNKAVGWFHAGVDWLIRGLEQNPNSTELAYNIGWTLYDRMDMYPEAIKWLTKTLRSEAPPFQTGRMIGHAYELSPDIERALEWYYRVLRMTPDDTVGIGATITLKMRFAHPWRLYEEGKYDEAYKEVYDWLATPHEEPNHIAWHLIATIAQAQGKYDLALKWWERCGNQYELDELSRRRIEDLRAKLGLPPWVRKYPGAHASPLIQE
jgi:hypothetical protein